jgi:hypothetical protein
MQQLASPLTYAAGPKDKTMKNLNNALHLFVQDENGYDLIEFALAFGLAGSVAVMALRNSSPEFARALTSITSHF